MVRLKLATVKCVEVFYRVACQFWEGWNSFGLGASLAYNEFVLTYVDSLLLAYLVEVASPKYAIRHFAIILLIEGSLNESSFDGQGRLGLDTLLAQTLDAFVHAAIVLPFA